MFRTRRVKIRPKRWEKIRYLTRLPFLSSSTLETDQLPFCCNREWLSISCISEVHRPKLQLPLLFQLYSSGLHCLFFFFFCSAAVWLFNWLEHQHLHIQLQSSEWQGVVLRGPVLHSFGTVNRFHWSAFRADSSPVPPQSAHNTHCRGDKGASLISTESPLSNQGNAESN